MPLTPALYPESACVCSTPWPATAFPALVSRRARRQSDSRKAHTGARVTEYRHLARNTVPFSVVVGSVFRVFRVVKNNDSSYLLGSRAHAILMTTLQCVP